MAPPLGMIAFGLSLVAFVLAIVAVATTAWTTADLGGGNDLELGLWELCLAGECEDLGRGKDCDQGGEELPNIANLCRKLNGTRAASILAVVFGLFAVAAAGKNAFGVTIPTVSYAQVGLALFAGFWSMVAFAVWEDVNTLFEVMSPEVGFGYSFVLAIIAWLLFWISAAPALLELKNAGATA